MKKGMIYHCHKCGADNKIVNQCGCDPNNLPTHPSAKKGLTVSIFKYKGFKGCANGGLSDHYDNVTLLASPDFPNVPEIFEPDEDAPAVVMVKRYPFNIREVYLTAYPADEDGNPDSDMRMAGGAYIYGCDSRFPADYPVPLHDRKE